MAWNPETYNKFKEERFAPFYDLLALINIRENMQVIDLGCGTGELTSKLAHHLPGSTILGIDSSAEMLNKSHEFKHTQLSFAVQSIEEQLEKKEQYDLVFSNAAIQWLPGHKILLPRLISLLKQGGQLAIQLPSQTQNISNKLLNELADREPYRSALQNYRRESPVLSTEEYAQLLFDNGGHTIIVYEKIYPLILENAEALFDWVSGTALLPYVEKLDGQTRKDFIDDYKKLLGEKFPGNPVFYPFKRIILSASFE